METLDRGFSSFEVTADEGLQAWGGSMGEAFVNAARGMFHLLVDLESLRPTHSREVKVQARDREGLLVAWLSELLFLFEVEDFLPAEYEITNITDQRLEARVQGDILDPARHSLKGLIKAATYHLLEVKEVAGRWQVQVVLDV